MILPAGKPALAWQALPGTCPVVYTEALQPGRAHTHAETGSRRSPRKPYRSSRMAHCNTKLAEVPDGFTTFTVAGSEVASDAVIVAETCHGLT